MTGDRAAQQVVTWRRVLVSEFGKAARARSVQVLIALELCLVVFFSAVVGVPGVQAALLPAGLAGVVTAGADYSSGAIMSTVVAVGRRTRLFWAQLVSAAVVTALPALVLMLGLVLTTRPYVDYRGVPFDLAASLETVIRAALVLALVAAAGALVAMGTRSVATAVMTLALGVGAAQMLAMLVPALLTLGSWTVQLPDWVHVVNAQRGHCQAAGCSRVACLIVAGAASGHGAAGRGLVSAPIPVGTPQTDQRRLLDVAASWRQAARVPA
ncbi:hypothetical protein [Actinomyces sp.]|uniref:hypothetical protein n=1 Tax=Actinomyces sp. TaxID=29317 RepID=UPI0026DC94DA|nr:hypothetical protein [Actinomyces sp.]MDO4899577.1 hypothetical protein [Actinomyces sp.]